MNPPVRQRQFPKAQPRALAQLRADDLQCLAKWRLHSVRAAQPSPFSSESFLGRVRRGEVRAGRRGKRSGRVPRSLQSSAVRALRVFHGGFFLRGIRFQFAPVPLNPEWPRLNCLWAADSEASQPPPRPGPFLRIPHRQPDRRHAAGRTDASISDPPSTNGAGYLNWGRL